MSNEEIYRQIYVLDQQLAELRSQLSHPQEWSAPRLAKGKSLEEQEQGDPFRIHSEAEMQMTNLPDLAKLILDALPLQVYIKKADTNNPRNARQYTYLNKAVRDLNGGWTRDEVMDKYDRDVFGPGERGDELYRQMQMQETHTIDRRKSRMTRTVWNQPGGYWTRNENIEIPILDQNGMSIGFCSLAQNFVFDEASRILAIYQQSARHRVFNLSSSVSGLFMIASSKLNAYLSNNPNAVMLTEVVKTLDQIRYELNLYNNSSQFQIEAFDSMDRAHDAETVGDIINTLQEAYIDCGFTLNICRHTPEGYLRSRVLHPKTVKAILSVFIANAVREHQPDSATGEAKQCSIDCLVSNGKAVWTVSNPCYPDAREYAVDDEVPTTIEDVMEKGFDKRMLTYFVINTFPGKKPSEMISTTTSEDPQRFNATLTVEVEDNA